jgi:hypothetical protein
MKKHRKLSELFYKILNHGPRLINPFTLKIIFINRIGLSISFISRVQPPSAKNSHEFPQNLELSGMKNRPNFYKKGVQTDICFSSTLKPGKTMKDIIGYGHVMDTKLLWFRKIHLHAPAKSGL